MKIDVDKLAPSTVTIEELLAIIRALQTKVADLERRLGLNSSNSGKPPNTDGLHKPSPKSQRSPTGKGLAGKKAIKVIRSITLMSLTKQLRAPYPNAASAIPHLMRLS